MSFWLNVKRVSRYGVAGFVRNGFVSLAAIAIMTITLFVLAFMIIFGAALRTTLTELTNKVDVTVYFTTNATEEQIVDVQKKLRALPQVADVEYTSRDQALEEFKTRHKNDQLTMQALDELGENPLGASLEIRAKEPSQYETIAKYLDAQQKSGIGSGLAIDKINFYQNKTAIDRLAAINDSTQRAGIAIAIIFGLASILIAFNTIRLAIYTSKDEIEVMNLVGAGPWYVRGPFMVAGVLYGFLSGIIVLVALYPLTAWIGPGSERFLGTFNVFTYYKESFLLLLVVVMGSGIVIGAFSSFLAVRRYLYT